MRGMRDVHDAKWCCQMATLAKHPNYNSQSCPFGSLSPRLVQNFRKALA